MSTNYQLVIALTLLPGVVTCLRGDEPDKPIDAPEAVARKAMQALKDDRLEDFARAMHPDALKRFKAMLQPVVEVASEGQKKQLLTLFSGVQNADDLKKLDDSQFFIAFYRGVTRLRPELKQVLGGAEAQILGHVMEGKDTAHVVFRMTMTTAGAKITKMNVLSLQRTESGWGMLLSGDIEGMANLLRQKFGGAK